MTLRTFHKRCGRRIIPVWALTAALALTGLPAPAPAQDQEMSSERLREIERRLDESRNRLENHQERSEQLLGEMEELREKSVEAALEVQKREARLTRVEKRLTSMLLEEIKLVDRLKERQKAMISVLSALQSMDRNKPPALLVRPDDAVAAARTAMLLGAVIPDIHKQAEILGKELDQLTELRTGIEAERDELREAGDALQRERKSLEMLLSEKERLQKATEMAAEAEAARVARYAAQARTLRGVVEELERRGARVDPRARPHAGQALRPNRRKPSAKDMKGRLRAPVAGRVVLSFGDPDETGAALEGLRFVTRPGAQVVAPFDAKVVFAQPYRSYGQVLILAAQDGYHFVLTGLDQIYGVVGQELLAGEPVGMMGPASAEARQVAQTDLPDGAQNGPKLYFELRRNGQPINPLPWLAGWTRPVSG